jgi:hypothetical protein
MLSVQDKQGRIVASAANVGGSWGAAQLAENYRGCTSLGFSTPLGYRPPPCPLEPR